MSWLALASADAAPAPIGAVAVIDRPVALVDGVAIWQSELDDRVAMSLQGKADRGQRAALVDAMIDDQLLLAKVSWYGPDEHEIDRALDEIRKLNQLDDAALDKALADQHLTRAQYRRELARGLRLARAAAQELAPRVDEELAREVADRKANHGKAEPNNDLLRAERMAAAREAWLVKHRKLARIDRRLP